MSGVQRHQVRLPRTQFSQNSSVATSLAGRQNQQLQLSQSDTTHRTLLQLMIQQQNYLHAQPSFTSTARYPFLSQPAQPIKAPPGLSLAPFNGSLFGLNSASVTNSRDGLAGPIRENGASPTCRSQQNSASQSFSSSANHAASLVGMVRCTGAPPTGYSQQNSALPSLPASANHAAGLVGVVEGRGAASTGGHDLPSNSSPSMPACDVTKGHEHLPTSEQAIANRAVPCTDHEQNGVSVASSHPNSTTEGKPVSDKVQEVDRPQESSVETKGHHVTVVSGMVNSSSPGHVGSGGMSSRHKALSNRQISASSAPDSRGSPTSGTGSVPKAREDVTNDGRSGMKARGQISAWSAPNAGGSPTSGTGSVPKAREDTTNEGMSGMKARDCLGSGTRPEMKARESLENESKSEMVNGARFEMDSENLEKGTASKVAVKLASTPDCSATNDNSLVLSGEEDSWTKQDDGVTAVDQIVRK